jgi:hypothetical protein
VVGDETTVGDSQAVTTRTLSQLSIGTWLRLVGLYMVSGRRQRTLGIQGRPTRLAAVQQALFSGPLASWLRSMSGAHTVTFPYRERWDTSPIARSYDERLTLGPRAGP